MWDKNRVATRNKNIDSNRVWKIMVAIGTRPEGIKMCPLIKELQKSAEVQLIICCTGQHTEMMQQVLNVFQVNPDYRLHIMKQSQTLSSITVSILEEFGAVLEKEHPDLCLVHGDTSTSYAAALSAFYHHIPVGHVESGLRTYNLLSPYPEEFNRQSVDLISELCFAPTQQAKENLIREGKSEDKIFVTGNTVIDALRTTIDKDYNCPDLEWASDSRLLLVTAHRRENIGAPMERMFRAINRIVNDNSDVKVIYPLHKNPAVRDIAYENLKKNTRIKLVEPLDVLDFHNYMARSYLILTDSGGIQEEAPALGKPVLVMRDTTERPEGIKAGTLKLVGTAEDKIYKAADLLLHDQKVYREMSTASNPYGNGYASELICDGIKQFLVGTSRIHLYRNRSF